jgi:hypothetical protein
MRGFGIRDVGAWILVASGIAALVTGLSLRVVRSQAVAIRRPAGVPDAGIPGYPAESLARVVVTKDLFRADRRPAGVPYDPSRGGVPLPDGPPKPQLVLTGVVWGDQPEAVVEGLPATMGPRVVRVGDVVAGVTIKEIERDRLVATGFDTTWTLTVRVPWK